MSGGFRAPLGAARGSNSERLGAHQDVSGQHRCNPTCSFNASTSQLCTSRAGSQHWWSPETVDNQGEFGGFSITQQCATASDNPPDAPGSDKSVAVYANRIVIVLPPISRLFQSHATRQRGALVDAADFDRHCRRGRRWELRTSHAKKWSLRDVRVAVGDLAVMESVFRAVPPCLIERRGSIPELLLRI